MPTLLVVILHDVNRLPDLMDAWTQIGVGVTLLPSMGGREASVHLQRSGLSSLLGIFSQGKPGQRTLWSIIDDDERLEQAIAEADRVVKGFDRPNSGILFTLPVGRAAGLKKWGRPTAVPEESPDETPESSSRANLLRWFQEDLQAIGQEDFLEATSAMRQIPVAALIPLLDLQPAVVRMDTPLSEVVTALVVNFHVPVVCVVNNEDRLMGMIDLDSLASALLIGIMPEEFLENPAEYERVLQYAQGQGVQLAADALREPLCVHPEDSLEEAFQTMRTNHFSGLPVVDTHYHLVGYINMISILMACFQAEAPAE